MAFSISLWRPVVSVRYMHVSSTNLAASPIWSVSVDGQSSVCGQSTLVARVRHWHGRHCLIRLLGGHQVVTGDKVVTKVVKVVNKV